MNLILPDKDIVREALKKSRDKWYRIFYNSNDNGRQQCSLCFLRYVDSMSSFSEKGCIDCPLVIIGDKCLSKHSAWKKWKKNPTEDNAFQMLLVLDHCLDNFDELFKDYYK